ARVAPQLRRMKDRTPLSSGSTVRTVWQPYMENSALRYGAGFLNMNFGPSIKCDDFYDASHMAGNCFPEFTDYLFDNVTKMARSK
ncbi:MAG: DUF1574 family protein, partial [Spirochaetia bacterium]|nr:DUF1574 family protein [Spirochaetia bacterium]